MVLKVSVDVLGMNYMAGKVAAVAISFVMNYGLRRGLLFTASLRPASASA